jgi:hypothetical protein
MLGIALLLFQIMISAKAGLVNYVDGQANVHLHEQVAEGRPIETQAQGHVELLLTPGSFLRVGSDSKVVLDSVELNRVALRLIDGTALVEVAEIEKDAPITVTTGNLQTIIVSRGIYRFSGGTASVVDGKLRVPGAHTTLKKGHTIASTDNGYVASTLAAPNDDLDRWSQGRSAALANANAMAYKDQSSGTYSSSLAYYPYWNVYSNHSSWLYSSLLGGFTFIPRGGYRSYYGYTFVPVSAFGSIPAFAVRPGRTLGGPGSSAGTTSTARPGGSGRPSSGGFHPPSGGGHPGGHGPTFHGGGRGGGHR